MDVEVLGPSGRAAAVGNASRRRADTITHLHRFGVDGERDEPEAVREDLVLDDGGAGRAVPDVDVLNGERRHLGAHDAAEDVSDGGVGADQVDNPLIGPLDDLPLLLATLIQRRSEHVLSFFSALDRL